MSTIGKYKQAISIKPDAAAYLNMGLAYGKKQQHQQAIEAMKKAIDLNPDYALAHFHLGAIYNSLGKKTEGQKEIDTLKTLDTTLATRLEGESNLGKTEKKAKDLLVKGMDQLKVKEYEEARITLEEAVKADPNSPTAHINLAFAYRHLKEPEKAIGSLKEAIQLKPDDSVAYNNLGVVYLGMEKPQEASEALKEAIRLKSDNASAHFNLGCSYLKLGKKDEALQEQSLLKNQDQKMADSLLALINQGGIPPTQAQEEKKPKKSAKQIEREINRDAQRILEKRKKQEQNAFLPRQEPPRVAPHPQPAPQPKPAPQAGVGWRIEKRGEVQR